MSLPATRSLSLCVCVSLPRPISNTCFTVVEHKLRTSHESVNKRKQRLHLRMNHLLFGRDGLLQVPQFEGVVLRYGDQHGLHRVEGQGAHAVKVAPQRVLGVPRLPERVLVGRQLGEAWRGRRQMVSVWMENWRQVLSVMGIGKCWLACVCVCVYVHEPSHHNCSRPHRWRR